jgi:hypothetical protein
MCSSASPTSVGSTPASGTHAEQTLSEESFSTLLAVQMAITQTSLGAPTLQWATAVCALLRPSLRLRFLVELLKVQRLDPAGLCETFEALACPAVEDCKASLRSEAARSEAGHNMYMATWALVDFLQGVCCCKQQR